MLKEFRDFINRGNVMDLAVGVIIGGAFGKIVSSMVDNLISPVIGFLLGGLQLKDALPVKLKDAKVAPDGTIVSPELVMKFGAFIQSVIDFIAIAFVLFLIVKAMNNIRKKQEVAPAAPPAPTNEEKLLMEIRDALKK